VGMRNTLRTSRDAKTSVITAAENEMWKTKQTYKLTTQARRSQDI